jgi:hypothetical protein
VTLPAREQLFCARCQRPVRLPKRPAPAEEVGLGRVLVVLRKWPEGHLCSGCFARACETYGRCAGCGVQRLVPGIGKDGEALYTTCAGGLGDFTCTRCGIEGWLHYAGICGRCVLADRLKVILDDGTGAIRPELVPFFDSVCAMSRPRSGILWLTKPHVPSILRAIALDQVPLTHDGLSTCNLGVRSSTSATCSSAAGCWRRWTATCSSSSSGCPVGCRPSRMPTTTRSCTASPRGTCCGNYGPLRRPSRSGPTATRRPEPTYAKPSCS